jgi:hypothetical protein
MTVALGMLAGALIGALLTSALLARPRSRAGAMIGQVRQLRSEVAELGQLYAMPAAQVSDERPRATVTSLLS